MKKPALSIAFALAADWFEGGWLYDLSAGCVAGEPEQVVLRRADLDQSRHGHLVHLPKPAHPRLA